MAGQAGAPYLSGMNGSPHEADPVVAEAVIRVRDRFGAVGLRDMVALARHEIEVAEAALAQLAQVVDETPPEPTTAGKGPVRGGV